MTNKEKIIEEFKWSDHFYYDDSSSSGLRRKNDWRAGRYGNTIRAKAGDVAGSLQPIGYYAVRLGKKLYLCHRIIYELFYGCLGNMCIDHIDGDSKNNQIENLRCVGQKTNSRNTARRITNESGKCGVSLTSSSRKESSDCWRAHWTGLDGIRHTRSFSIRKFGNEVAYELACECRDSAFKLLQEAGAGYTERHGT